ncbi:HTH-type transcriptional regulator AscG [Micromonospora noduli]|uniref:HTH-type transcriptional regulator AscG n=1 Tax=Micromonospora noduli TaxID=709876 RepID=A0A328N0P3_9ACTN|nr:LacI family DNA-binding transcriptional regulator [Micromonospora noduli]KAB1918445.1 LacI family transcriptional regulator [Micromonospora noduli]RAN99549.1 HTH-type transcriptional regulator AscG [Micromonospora noduli]RAO21615.1 HTH-type transcriptional regulator AscG [Micromonospora noduli]RAO28356.1 HTH-type transcriptional regulator AscG [Micromonospora noduli]RAO51180.1 HTH-type transcriptional regulator AscG [Micromonospora noduli]
MRQRLKDVAERAGVSVKTVSNVVNGYVHVRPDTRARVEEAIAELNYRPNLSARHLRKGRTGVIALAVPELDIPYFAELARYVVTAAAAYGWTVLIDQTGGRREQERVVASGITDHLIDGLIFSPLALTAEDLAGLDGTPMVLLGERVEHGPADRVVIDNVTAAREITAHLIQLGHRRIAAIGSQRTDEGASARLRLAGYTDALRAAGLDYDETLVAPASAWHRADGAAAMRGLLTSGVRPDAVFCFNDTLALGALRALHEAGLRVPEDVAVVGFDDIEDGRFSIPTLSTVAPDKEKIAQLAVELLANRLDGDRTAPAKELSAPYRLELRESTQAP